MNDNYLLDTFNGLDKPEPEQNKLLFLWQGNLPIVGTYPESQDISFNYFS